MTTTSTSTPGLESPPPTAKPKGLVPRSAIWLMIAILLGGLIAYAAYDINKETKRKRIEDAKGPNAVLGAEPSQDALKKIMADQAAKAASAAADQVAHAQAPTDPTRVGLAVARSSQPPVPPDVMSRAGAGAPVATVNAASARTSDREGDAANAKAIAAHAELQARINGSSMVAIDGRSASGSGGGTGSATGNGTGARSGSRLAFGEQANGEDQQQVLAQAMAEAGAAGGQVPNVDAIIKAMSATRGGTAANGTQSAVSRDSSWVKDVAESKAAPVSYATQAPTRNLLLQGTRIPAVTLEAVNSDLPGQITARATQDLRDSLTQRAVLVPAGTRFVGSYNAEVSPGQSRVLMAFSRMILPDGRSVDLHASQATDAIGQSGVTGDVDNHFLKMYAYSLAVAVAGERLGNKGVTTGASVTGLATGTKTIAGEVLADVSKRILDRNSNIPPTITTPVGARIYITITRDIALAPWKD